MLYIVEIYLISVSNILFYFLDYIAYIIGHKLLFTLPILEIYNVKIDLQFQSDQKH